MLCFTTSYREISIGPRYVVRCQGTHTRLMQLTGAVHATGPEYRCAARGRSNNVRTLVKSCRSENFDSSRSYRAKVPLAEGETLNIAVLNHGMRLVLCYVWSTSILPGLRHDHSDKRRTGGKGCQGRATGYRRLQRYIASSP